MAVTYEIPINSSLTDKLTNTDIHHWITDNDDENGITPTMLGMILTGLNNKFDFTEHPSGQTMRISINVNIVNSDGSTTSLKELVDKIDKVYKFCFGGGTTVNETSSEKIVSLYDMLVAINGFTGNKTIDNYYNRYTDITKYTEANENKKLKEDYSKLEQIKGFGGNTNINDLVSKMEKLNKYTTPKQLLLDLNDFSLVSKYSGNGTIKGDKTIFDQLKGYTRRSIFDTDLKDLKTLKGYIRPNGMNQDLTDLKTLRGFTGTPKIKEDLANKKILDGFKGNSLITSQMKSFDSLSKFTGNGKIDEYSTKLGNLSKFNGSSAIDTAHNKFNDIKNFDGGSATFKNAVSNLNSITSFKMPSALSEARSLMEEANAWTAKKF